MTEVDPERFGHELDRFVARQGLSRRRFLGRGAATVLMAGGLAQVLAACGIDGTAARNLADLERQARRVNHPRTELGDWTFSNWPLYIDKSVIKDFNAKYGGHCKYVEEINDNNEFYGKVRQQLAAGVPIGRDIVTLTDYMASRWVRFGYVTPIDKRNVPNGRRLVRNLRSITYDPRRQFTLPWQSGAIGIGYDIKQTGGEVRSLRELFDPRWKGRVTLFSEPYDSAGSVLLMEGVDASRATLDQMLGAIERIGKANDDGQFRRFTGNDYTTDLTKGNIALALAYSGDLVQLQSDNPNMRFAYPEEGAMQFTDNMMMPAKVEHPYAAETMMNYVYEPAVAAKICAYVNYISPVEGIKEILERTDPEIASNELIFPPDDVRAKLHSYPSFTTREEQQMYEAMAQVTGA
ncbi:spermidine/putrescine ABC transporter substrate-binding protein [Conexibacter sp. JD483]|uniref:polyamine ABC transporter substrate-binding protein n=1 Tax=unclassified Conexibacter TaxID=2627773 RepID=UPI00271D76F3|nr:MULTISPECIES: spermidine/putrescine ABC transporter substrate-binding protein [unclassified Conexibacter]MDO8185597.1 spermidine/putrescine ABC transporter substrate-binding protein [Conexibacter sp. CPCC 205706]MDO8198770.1 spermidine/putrescine ABC transporter substrate-binding protein [Conexibacter sp. CPCC 205762]MDR9367880.1 spermidine/putrescine ABC transporter substrate-binding protein [Conexibacter sp. JD483]